MKKRPALPTRATKKYGWIPDLPDRRDVRFLLVEEATRPKAADLRTLCPPVYNQGALGSCTAHAIAGALEFDQMKQGDGAASFVPSRLFIYYAERVIEGTVGSDSGAMIRDGMKAVAAQGAPHEKLWPYTIAKFAKKPPPSAFADAAQHPTVLYSTVDQSVAGIENCLALGFPVVFGFTVYESFESPQVASTGIVPMPTNLESVLGGHAVLCVGYDQTTQRFLVRNSWGAGWGLAGYFWMPYAYLTDPGLASDLWVVKAVK